MTSPRRSTALKMLNAFKTLDMETIMSLRAPNCTHIMAPASLGYRQPMDNTTYETSIVRFKDVISDWPVTVKEVMEDEKQKRVIIWATSNAVWKEEAKDDGEGWDWQGEYMFILSFDESGEKIERVVEFLDSKATVDLRELVARAMKNLERRA